MILVASVLAEVVTVRVVQEFVLRSRTNRALNIASAGNKYLYFLFRQEASIKKNR
jgi:hypothetical protein